MRKIEFLLIQITGFMFLNSPEALKFFNSPIEEFIDIPNKDLEYLYQWKNGNNLQKIKDSETYEFCSFGYFLSYEEALEYQKEFITDNYFKTKGYFPIIASLKGDFLLIDITKKNGKVYIYSPGLLINEPMEIYQSIEAFIETIYQCYYQKAYKYNQSSHLEVNFELENSIALKLNPKSEYWRQ